MESTITYTYYDDNNGLAETRYSQRNSFVRIGKNTKKLPDEIITLHETVHGVTNEIGFNDSIISVYSDKFYKLDFEEQYLKKYRLVRVYQETTALTVEIAACKEIYGYIFATTFGSKGEKIVDYFSDNY